METIYLHGSETMHDAATIISGAATEMLRAANIIDQSLACHRQWAEDWLSRLQVTLNANFRNF